MLKKLVSLESSRIFVPEGLGEIQPFQPAEVLLMGPGPSGVHPRVLAAMARPTVGHLDPGFSRMMEEVKLLLRYVFQTENGMTFPISAPATSGMEICAMNLIQPGDKVIVCINGAFGKRMLDMVSRIGGVPVTVNDDWGKPVDPNKLEDVLQQHPDSKVVFFVHAETSTGALSDAKTLVEIAHQHNALTLVDTVTSLGGVPVLVDPWEIDIVYSGSQKCLSVPPGLSPVSVSDRAMDTIRRRATKPVTWFGDMGLIESYWTGQSTGGKVSRTYHHTAPVNMLYGLHEGLLLLREEGIPAAWARHRANHELLREGLEALGLRFVVEDPAARLPQLNAVYVPEGMDAATEAAIRTKLRQEHHIEIGAGLGPLAGKIWRIGLMGHSSTPENVATFLEKLRTVLSG